MNYYLLSWLSICLLIPIVGFGVYGLARERSDNFLFTIADKSSRAHLSGDLPIKSASRSIRSARANKTGVYLSRALYRDSNTGRNA